MAFQQQLIRFCWLSGPLIREPLSRTEGFPLTEARQISKPQENWEFDQQHYWGSKAINKGDTTWYNNVQSLGEKSPIYRWSSHEGPSSKGGLPS